MNTVKAVIIRQRRRITKAGIMGAVLGIAIAKLLWILFQWLVS